jgi:hypothetical protein
MLNFTELLYNNIGSRVKAMRKSRKESQERFCYYTLQNQINISALSRIENGKNDKHKNPYLLSSTQIEILCEYEKIRTSQLIWGDDGEKEDLIKMLILAILMNSNKINPFENKELEEWAALETKINPNWENEIKNELSQDERIQYLKDKYGYFINSANANCYQMLDNHFEPAYEKLSNLILKLLLTDFKFSSSFISHLIQYTQNMAGVRQGTTQTDSIKGLIRDFVTNNGEYSVILLDNKSKDYALFIVAFEKFWNRYKNAYLAYFDENLFSLIDDTVGARNDLKYVQNPDFHSAFTTNEFIQLNEELLLLSDYDDSNSILTNMNFRLQLQQAMQMNLLADDKTDIAFLQCLNKIRITTSEQINQYYQWQQRESFREPTSFD